MATTCRRTTTGAEDTYSSQMRYNMTNKTTENVKAKVQDVSKLVLFERVVSVVIVA